jgi:signal transduction histidine kinase
VGLKYVWAVRRERFLQRFGFDLVLVLLAVYGGYEVTRQDADVLLPGTPVWVGVAGVVVTILPLFARRQFPFAAPVLVWVLGAAISFVDGRLVPSTVSIYAAGIAAAYLLGSLDDARRAKIGLAFVLGGAAIVVYNDPSHDVGDFIFLPATFAVAWVAGFALRSRAAQAEAAEQRASFAERERESAARLAVAEERARITRELHDIVAHAVSVMVLQVGAVRHQLPASMSDDKDALRAVEDTGREALNEMRRLLGGLHDEGRNVELEPQPGLDRLDSLVEKVDRAGLPVRVHIEGQPFPLPRAIDLSAYRIVQEGLTNSLKHAGARQADITVRYQSNGVELEVRDDGTGTGSDDGRGRGLTGIRERVKIYGGEMTAGAQPGGGFVLNVHLPVAGYQP